MSEEHVQLARAAYAAWKTGDMDGFAESFSDDVDVRPFLGSGLVASEYRGHEGLRSWYRDANEPWETLDVDPEEFVDLGDGRVVIFVTASGRGRGSHALVEARIVHVAKIRDGKIVELDGYANRNMALQALGISDLGESGDD